MRTSQCRMISAPRHTCRRSASCTHETSNDKERKNSSREHVRILATRPDAVRRGCVQGELNHGTCVRKDPLRRTGASSTVKVICECRRPPYWVLYKNGSTTNSYAFCCSGYLINVNPAEGGIYTTFHQSRHFQWHSPSHYNASLTPVHTPLSTPIQTGVFRRAYLQ